MFYLVSHFGLNPGDIAHLQNMLVGAKAAVATVISGSFAAAFETEEDCVRRKLRELSTHVHVA